MCVLYSRHCELYVIWWVSLFAFGNLWKLFRARLGNLQLLLSFKPMISVNFGLVQRLLISCLIPARWTRGNSWVYTSLFPIHNTDHFHQSSGISCGNFWPYIKDLWKFIFVHPVSVDGVPVWWACCEVHPCCLVWQRVLPSVRYNEKDWD